MLDHVGYNVIESSVQDNNQEQSIYHSKTVPLTLNVSIVLCSCENIRDLGTEGVDGNYGHHRRSALSVHGGIGALYPRRALHAS
jgi:hypothetical protein